MLSIANSDTPDAVYYFGEVATVTCDSGYVVSGDTTATSYQTMCKMDQTWSLQELCTRKKASTSLQLLYILYINNTDNFYM